MSAIVRYFKIATDEGNEYYFCKAMENKGKIPINTLFKIAIESKELPLEELDYIDSVEEVDYDEFLENYVDPESI